MDLFLTDICFDVIKCSNRHNVSLCSKANHSLDKLADVDHDLCEVFGAKKNLRLSLLILVVVC
jgi:hypothetical protein